MLQPEVASRSAKPERDTSPEVQLTWQLPRPQLFFKQCYSIAGKDSIAVENTAHDAQHPHTRAECLWLLHIRGLRRSSCHSLERGIKCSDAYGFTGAPERAGVGRAHTKVLWLCLQNCRVKGRPHYYSTKREEYAHVKFDLDAGTLRTNLT